MKTIQTSKLKEVFAKRDYTLLNVLPAESYKQGTLPCSKNACIYETNFAEQVHKLVPHKEAKVVVFGMDRRHNAAQRAGEVLASLGYSAVYVYRPGVLGWKDAGEKIVGAQKKQKQKLKQKYAVVPSESFIEWEGSNIANRHYGTLKIASGSLQVDAKRGMQGDIVVNMKSIKNIDQKDAVMRGYLEAHLKSSDFFDVVQFPVATMRIESVEHIGKSASAHNYKVHSRVTIKGVTKPVAFSVHGHMQDGSMYVQGAFVLDRSKWDVQYGSARFFEALGKHLVHDEVFVRFKVVAR